jgi:hypothetical protein
MDPQVERFLTSLYGARDFRSHHQIVNDWLAEGKLDLVGELLLALKQTSGIMQRQSYHVAGALGSKPGLDYAEKLLAFALTPPMATGAEAGYLASVLANAQSPSVLAALFDAQVGMGTESEVKTCLVQEMVLLGLPCQEIPGVGDYVRRTRHLGRPMARLPLTLMDLEDEYVQQRHLPTRDPWATPLETAGAQPQPVSVHGRSLSEIGREVTPTVDWRRWVNLKAAVVRWERESNGIIEARVFALNPWVSSEDVSVAGLMSLGLDCLRATKAKQVHISSSSASYALSILFSAASGGGAYSRPPRGAHGRLAAWQSLAGLVGARDDASVETIAALAKQCTWWEFTAENDWFFQVAWDLGLLALRPQGRSLAVLAATDTD